MTPNNYLWYTYSPSNSISSFDVNKYKDLKQENTVYIYDKDGFMLAVWNAKTMEQCIKEVKRYILKRILLTLTIGWPDKNYTAEDHRNERKEEWKRLKTYVKEYIKSRKTKHDEKTA
jgi:hypothetical protein